MDEKERINLKDALRAADFRFNKALGQNFLTDENLLQAIVCDSGVQKEDVVAEIGTGGGTLTRALSEKAGKVVSFEVDKNLQPVLALTLKGMDNVEVVFRDVLKMPDEQVRELLGDKFKVVANLPYYVTTPLIMRFIESGLGVESLTVTVQKEVANRLVAKVGTADYASITLAVEAFGSAHITRYIDRRMFYPSPNVDSAVVRIDADRDKLKGENIPLVKKLIRSAFSMRRKTYVNNLSSAFSLSKADAARALEAAGISPMARGETLSLEDFVRLSRVSAEFFCGKY